MTILQSVSGLSSTTIAARRYATGSVQKSSRLGATTLGLDHFLQRVRVLTFYREILRGTRRINDPSTKKETRSFARAEFERHRGVTDLGHLRYLLSTGKTEWASMERYIDGL